MPATFTPPQSSVAIIRLTCLAEFLRQLREDAQTVRHHEVRWTTQPVTEIADQQVLFETLIAGYITERDGHLAVIELRRLCGTAASDRRTEDASTQQQIAAALQALHATGRELGLAVKPGRFTLDPSPLMPTGEDVLRTFGPTVTSLGGTSYGAWTDGWGVGLECVRSDGLCTYLYLEPSQEQDDGRACVFCHLGCGGDPTEDIVRHVYDPFEYVALVREYTVLTENGQRDWTATDSEHAREQHEAAFGGEPGETIEDVYLTHSTANFPRLHIDSAAPKEVIVKGMMQLAQRLSCGHPDSPYIAVIAALRQIEEAEQG
jgi:hypothetical protein